MSVFKAGEIVLCLADSSCGGFTAGKLYIAVECDSEWVKLYDNNNKFNGWSTEAFRSLTEEEYTTAWDAEINKGDEVMLRYSVDSHFPSFHRYEAWGVNEEEFPRTVALATDGVYVGDRPKYTLVKTEFGLQGEEKQEALPVWDKEEVVEVVDTMEEDVVSLEDAPEVEEVEKQYITDRFMLQVGDYIYLEESVQERDEDFYEGLYRVTGKSVEGHIYLNHRLIWDRALKEGYLVEVDIKPIKREKPVASYRTEDYIIVEENGAYKVHERKA